MMKQYLRRIFEPALIPLVIGCIAGLIAVYLPAPYNRPFAIMLSENAAIVTTIFFYSVVSFSWGMWLLLLSAFPRIHERLKEGPRLLQYLPLAFVTYGSATAGLLIGVWITRSSHLLGVKSPGMVLVALVLLFVFASVMPFTFSGDARPILNRLSNFFMGLGYVLVLPHTYCVIMLNILQKIS